MDECAASNTVSKASGTKKACICFPFKRRTIVLARSCGVNLGAQDAGVSPRHALPFPCGYRTSSPYRGSWESLLGLTRWRSKADRLDVHVQDFLRYPFIGGCPFPGDEDARYRPLSFAPARGSDGSRIRHYICTAESTVVPSCHQHCFQPVCLSACPSILLLVSLSVYPPPPPPSAASSCGLRCRFHGHSRPAAIEPSALYPLLLTLLSCRVRYHFLLAFRHKPPSPTLPCSPASASRRLLSCRYQSLA